MKFIKIDQGAKITYINPANVIAIDHTLNEDGGHNLTFHCNNNTTIESHGMGEPMDDVVNIINNHSTPADNIDDVVNIINNYSAPANYIMEIINDHTILSAKTNRDKILESHLERLLQDYSYHHIIYKLSQLCEKKSKTADDEYAKTGLRFRWLSDTLTI